MNEGFATFAEFLCVANLFPEYDTWTQFVTETYSPALKLDALKSSHAVEVSNKQSPLQNTVFFNSFTNFPFSYKLYYFQVPVEHPHKIQDIFDGISYHKGASVIRMLHRYIGNEVSTHPGWPQVKKVEKVRKVRKF